MAKKGKLILPLLNELDSFEYYKKTPPKSLGVEWLNSKILPLLKNQNYVRVSNLVCKSFS